VSGADLLVGVLAGVVASAIWWALAWSDRRRRLRRDFGHLAGKYRVTRKLSDLPEPGTVLITVSGNTLRAHQFEGLPDGDSITGEISMNEHLPNTGRGHYAHVKGGKRLWGFWDIQVDDGDTLLVHTTYANYKTHVAVVSGFVWERLQE
jgi:hypothetical protein